MSIESNLPSSFWAEAILTANYIRNRCPSRALEGRTPFEIWTGRTPNVSHLREFGCKVFFMNRTPGRKKLDKRAKEGVLLGYSEQSKGYRVWNPEEKKIEITRDVTFSEDPRTRAEDLEDFIPEELEIRKQEDERFKGNEHREVNIEIRSVENNLEEERPMENHENENQENEFYEDVEDEAEGQHVNIDAVPRRGPGRPRKILTGLRGRPRKQYQE